MTAPDALERAPGPLSSEGYPCFSDAERARRWALLESAMDAAGCDTAVCYGADRAGSAVQWFTGWPTTREAALVVCPGAERVLFVQHANHVANAERMAHGVRVAWGGSATLEAVSAHLAGLARRGGRLGTIGALPARGSERLGALVGLDGAYVEMRLRKSAEELAFLRFGAELTDRAVARLAGQATPGMTEVECCALFESAFLPSGGTNHIHYLSSTPMDAPARSAPAQWPSFRRLEVGDALVCEVSVDYFGYPGQLLRTFSVGASAPERYRLLHEAAETTFEAIAAAAVPGATVRDLREAAQGLARAGYETCDDLVHGFVGGYLPPLLAGGGRPGGTSDEFVLEEGMALVIQPNAVERGRAAGVQTGELGVLTLQGWQSLHRFPAGLARIA